MEAGLGDGFRNQLELGTVDDALVDIDRALEGLSLRFGQFRFREKVGIVLVRHGKITKMHGCASVSQ